MSNVGDATYAADYLTTTWPTPINETVMISKRNVMDWARETALLRGAGNWVKPWAWKGYTGYSCGPVSVGERLDGCILRLSSVAAHSWLADGFTAGHNISRIDVAATIWGVFNQTERIARHKVEADEHRKALRHKPYKVRLEDGVGDGDTLYIGSRDSQLFVRIYDKERDPKAGPEYKGAIRYEAECKEEYARKVYEGLTSTGYSMANCNAVLGGILERRGVSPVYIGCIQPKNIPNSALPRSDVERSLIWLRSQVKPTLQNLMRMGYEEEALKALGLDKFWRDYGETA